MMHVKKFSISVGLTVYLNPLGNAAYRTDDQSLIEAKIARIGRKYFYVEAKTGRLFGGEAKFDKETFQCWDGDNNYGYKIYLHPYWYEWEVDKRKKIEEMRKVLDRNRDDLPYGVVCQMYDSLMCWKNADKEDPDKMNETGEI